MTNKKDFSPMVYQFKNSVMEHVENTDLFNSSGAPNKNIFVLRAAKPASATSLPNW